MSGKRDGCSSAPAARAGPPHSFTASAISTLAAAGAVHPSSLHPAPAWKWHSPQGQRQVLVPETSKWADPRVGLPGFHGQFTSLRRFQREPRSRVGVPTTRAKPALEQLSAHVSRGDPVPAKRAERRGPFTAVTLQGRPSRGYKMRAGCLSVGICTQEGTARPTLSTRQHFPTES